MRVATWLPASLLLGAAAGIVLWGLVPSDPEAVRVSSSSSSGGPSSLQPSVRPVSAPSAAQPAEVLRVVPTGDWVKLGSPIEVQFSTPVDPQSVTESWSVRPPRAGKLRFLNPQTLRFTVDAWQAGKTYEVSFRARDQMGTALGETRWIFRTRVPRPKQIVPGNGSNLVFTFDDGPRDFAGVERLLELLARKRVRAIFFPTAHSLRKRPDWIGRIRSAGHQVCNHTYSHTDLSQSRLGEAGMRSEIARGAAHGRCQLLRPPGMAYNERTVRVARDMGYELFLWDVDSRDWEGIRAREIRNRVLRGVRPGAVVLFHMQGEHTYEALPGLIRRLRRAGYVLSYDPADLDEPSKFGIGHDQTWVGDVKVQTRRWRLPDEPSDTHPPWPFVDRVALPAWARRARSARREKRKLLDAGP